MESNNLYPYDETFLPEEKLKELTERLQTPFYLYDEMGLRNTMRKIRRAFAWCDNFQQFFPMCMTPNPEILKILRDEGCGVLCGTMSELLLAERCGFQGDLVIFGPMFPEPEALRLMQELRGTYLVDNPDSARACLQMGVLPEKVLLCYNPGGKFKAGQQTISRPERSKLGMDYGSILETASLFLQSKVKRFGINASLTRQTLEPNYFGGVLKQQLELSRQLEQLTGIKVESCNLGGGVGLGFLPEIENGDILAMGENARRMAEQEQNPIRMIQTDVGRYLTGPNGILIAKVLCVKNIYRSHIVLDAATSHFIRPLLNAYHHISVLGKTQKSNRLFYDVVGVLPTGEDRFAEKRMLPQVQAGDFCVIHDAGFNGAAMQNSFGGVLRCGEYLYGSDGSVRQIGAPGTLEDLFRVW